jgi:hypothetical protein
MARSYNRTWREGGYVIDFKVGQSLGEPPGYKATGFIDPLVLPSVTWSALLVERERLTGALARSVQCLHQRHGLKCIFEVRWQC